MQPNSLILDRFDGLLITWIINWNVHSLLTSPLNYFNANIFFPYHNTLAFSDYHFLHGLIALPFVTLFGEPLLAYNINFFFGFVLTGWAMYLLCLQLTKDYRVSLLSGVLFCFSVIHLNYMVHLQLFSFYPVIFTLLFLVKKKYRLYCLFFVLSVLNMPLNLFFLLTIVPIFLLFNRSQIKKTFLATVISCVLIVPFLWPYLSVSKEFAYVRPIQDTIHFSLKYFDLWSIGPNSRLEVLLPSGMGTPAFLGAVFLFLILWMGLTKLKAWFPLLLALIAFILSFGPAFHIFANTVRVGILPAIPMPYLLLYYLVPGFSAFRTPSRWILLTAFALTVAIALQLKNKVSRTMVAILIVLIIAEIRMPIDFVTVPNVKQFPAEQVWLQTNRSDKAIIQFPIYNWSDQPEFGEETLRMYYSTIHYRPMFNGFSGFSPEEWQQQVFSWQKEFPSEKSVNEIKAKDIGLILVPIEWRTRMADLKTVQLVAEFPNKLIYEIK